MTLDLLAILAGTLLSLIFSYIPGLKVKFDQFTPEAKRLIMLGLLVAVSGGVFSLSCAGWLNQLWPEVVVTCDQQGLLALVRILVLATISNQTTYMITPLKAA